MSDDEMRFQVEQVAYAADYKRRLGDWGDIDRNLVELSEAARPLVRAHYAAAFFHAAVVRRVDAQVTLGVPVEIRRVGVAIEVVLGDRRVEISYDLKDAHLVVTFSSLEAPIRGVRRREVRAWVPGAGSIGEVARECERCSDEVMAYVMENV